MYNYSEYFIFVGFMSMVPLGCMENTERGQGLIGILKEKYEKTHAALRNFETYYGSLADQNDHLRYKEWDELFAKRTFALMSYRIAQAKQQLIDSEQQLIDSRKKREREFQLFNDLYVLHSMQFEAAMYKFSINAVNPEFGDEEHERIYKFFEWNAPLNDFQPRT